jgi:hypothetical protein
VLTKTQLSSAKTAELELLQTRIAQELTNRRQIQEGQPPRNETSGKDQLFYSGRDGHYQWEFVQCGHKNRCQRCQSGRKHGPYLYRYFYQNGKQKSQYIKLSDLAKHPEAPPRPV